MTVWSCGGRGAEVVHALICWLTLTVGNQKHALVVCTHTHTHTHTHTYTHTHTHTHTLGSRLKVSLPNRSPVGVGWDFKTKQLLLLHLVLSSIFVFVRCLPGPTSAMGMAAGPGEAGAMVEEQAMGSKGAAFHHKWESCCLCTAWGRHTFMSPVIIWA